MKVAILLTQQHRLLSVAAIQDFFQSVNSFYIEEDKEPFFDIKLIYADQKMKIQYSDFSLSSIKEKDKMDIVLIPAFKNDDMSEGIKSNMDFISFIIDQYKNGAALASFCTGSFLLAATGLLDNNPATTHINAKYAFQKFFPHVLLQPDEVVTQSNNLYTSGGATNTFHLLIRLVENFCSRKMALRVAKIFSIDIDRKSQTYFGTFLPDENHNDEIVKKTQQQIRIKYKTANTIEEIVSGIPASRRNLVRRFKQVTGLTPIEYLQKTRIEVAKSLLENSNQNIIEIMYESGYNDLKSFRLVFKKNVGMTPTAYREKFYN